jgi:malate synthase
MSNKNIKVENTEINEVLYNFINNEVLPDTDISENDFWNGFIKAANELAPVNKELLKKRDVIQSKIDEWHKSNKEKIDFSSYKNF